MNTHSKKRSAGKSACRKPGARFGLLAGLLLTALGSQVQGQIDSGLVSYWPLDEIQGTKTPDVKSFYDMELSNLTSDDVVPGKHGNAFSFSNERQTLLSRVHEAGDNLPANKHESHTISMWVNVEGEGQNDLRVFSEGNTSNSNPLFNIGTHNGGSDGTVDFYIRQSGWSTFGHAHSGQTAFDGTWHHIAWVQDGGDRVLYVDGVADELEIEPKPEGEWLLNDTSIGGILRASASHWVTGLIDDVAIWSRALSEEEVGQIAGSAVGDLIGGGGGAAADPTAEGLVAHWPLDEIQGTKTPDVVSGYDMEITNLTADDVVPGHDGNAFSFSNERQTLLSRVHDDGDDLPANKHAAHTISMWVNVEGEGQNDLRVFSEGNTSNSNPLFNIGTHNGGSDGTVDFYIRQSGWSTFGHAHSGQTAFDGTWHHVVWVQETDGSRMLYVDGVADELEIEPKPEGDWLLNDTSIGGILRASASHWVTGLIDDVAIWKRALSEDEVNSVGQNGVPSPSSGGGNRPPGLVAHWPLDEIQGTKTPDIVSGYDMDITNLTAADVVPGQNGNAFSFSNERQTLLSRVHEADEDLPANKHESHTITMWVNIEGQGQNDLRVFSEGNTENSNPLFNIGTHNGGSDGTVDFYIRQSGWSTYGHAHSGQTAFDSTWRHIAWVQDGGDRVLYVDGVADELEIEPKPEGDWLLNDTSIGGILRASASHWVTGLIDDVAIWKRALSEDEINSVIQNGVPKVTSGNLRPLGIASFDSEFSAVAGGGTAILTWDASADANLSINRGVGDVTAASEFGVGSVEVQVDASTTYTLTATRGNESTSATVFVTAYDGIEDGWSLIENFELREETSINGQHRWKNPEGTTAVVDTEGPFGKAMTLQGSALSALLLGSKTLKEGEKATLFYRVVGYDGDEPAIQCNVGLSEKPVRFIGDFDNDVGPFVQMSDIEGFGLDMYAINGFGEALDWTGSTVDYETVYNVWMDVTNLGLEEGDLFTVYFQDASGGDRTEAFKGYASDRNPAGSTDLGLPGPDLDTLFISSHNGALQANQFLVDDFYISSGGFNASVPTAPGGVSMIPEVDEPDVAGSISGIAVSDNKVVISFTGQLKSSDSVTGPYAPVAGASGDSYEVNPDQAQQFYIAE